MSTSAKLAGFLVAVAAVFALSLAVGRVVGPIDDEPVAHDDSHAAHPSEAGHGDEHNADVEPSATNQIPGGLMVSQNGYTLALSNDTSVAGDDRPLTFTITGLDGSPVTDYDVEHEKKLHLIAIRRDFSGFQHVHPSLDDDGVWTTDLDLTPGTWRIFADFKASGADALTLGTDLAVTGDFEPVEPAAENRTATAGDYKVTLDGDLSAGADAKLTLSVTKNGEPVTDLQPYLGAYGHLVALHAPDLAYSHVHPAGEDRAAGAITFDTELHERGAYRLFLQFRTGGRVHTVAFTQTVS